MKIRLIVIFTAIIFTSYTTTYVVNSVNAPLLTDRNEFQAGVNYKGIFYVDYLKSKNGTANFAAVEPVITFQIGRKFVLVARAGLSLYLNNYKGEYNPFTSSSGIKYYSNNG